MEVAGVQITGSTERHLVMVMSDARILIAKDNAIVADNLERSLIELGYEIPGVVPLDEDCFEKIKLLQPDIIIMEISPEEQMKKVEIVASIQSGFELPVICLTDQETLAILQKESMTDSHAYLVTPFETSRLQCAIEIALSKRRLEKRLRSNESWYQTIFEANASAMTIIAENGTIEMINEEFERLSGYSRECVESRMFWSDFLTVDDMTITVDNQCVERIDALCRTSHYVARFIDRKGCAQSVYANVRMIPGTRKYVLSLSDITGMKLPDLKTSAINAELKRINVNLKREIIELKNIEKKLTRQASRDPLTGLPNRNLFFDRLRQALAFVDRHNSLLAVMLLDLDNFKDINDTLGHMSGDFLLQEVAKRLQQCMRQYDTVARFGGDEFVIIVNDIKEVSDIARFAEKIRASLRQPFDIFGYSSCISASIGIVVYPQNGCGVENLLKRADMAMYQAKKEGKNSFRLFSDTMSLMNNERTVMKERLGAAMERGEFLPHYQPCFDITTGKITGIEALIRWQPQGAPLSFPADFLPLLEESGLIVPVGDWMLEKICRQIKSWQDAGLPPLRVSVNVSARQFRNDDLAESIAGILSETGLDPHYLEIDLTEKIAMVDMNENIKKMEKLKKLGTAIAIGNFGIGDTSLICLSRLPIDRLKIDKSLIKGVTADRMGAKVVTTAIAMGLSLGKKIVAEGVESAEEYDFLAKHRCKEMQGYYFSKPLSSEDFERMVRRKTSVNGHSYHRPVLGI